MHVLAREIDAVPRGVTAERVGWADEHGAPGTTARVEALRALAAFAPDVAVAHNVMDAGIVEALRAAPRLAYHVHDHRPFCPNGDRVFPRSGRNCTQPLGRPCAVHSLTDGCAYGPRPRTLTLIRRRERLRDAIAAADATIAASRYVAERAMQCEIPPDRLVEIPLPLPDDAYADASRAAAASRDDRLRGPRRAAERARLARARRRAPRTRAAAAGARVRRWPGAERDARRSRAVGGRIWKRTA